jgi:phage protein D
MQYGRSLIEFQPTLEFNRQVSKVEVRGWDPVKGQKIQVTVGQSDLGQNGLNGKIKPGSKNPVADRTEVLTSPVRDEAAAREVGLGYLRRINDVLVTASGSVVGLPDLQAGRQVEISGLGLRFNGRYFLTKTTHRLSNSGYVTQFECRLQLLSNVTEGEAL